MSDVADRFAAGSSPARRHVHAGVAIAISAGLLLCALFLLVGASLLYYDEEGGVNYVGSAAVFVWTGPLPVILLAVLSLVLAVRAFRGRHRLVRWALTASTTVVAGFAYLSLIPPQG